MKKAFTRKEFLTSSCKAGCALLAGFTALSSLESCSTIKVYKAQATDGKISVPISEFTENNMRIVRVASLDYDIVLIKKEDGQFNALYMRCTHQDWQLTANAKGLNCSMHGSAFDLDGNVVNGPATNPLKKFNVTTSKDMIIIS